MLNFQRVLAALVFMKASLLAAEIAGPQAPENSGFLDPAFVFDNSQLWPFYTSLLSETTLDGRMLDGGLRGVVIRMISPTRILVDFGRDGMAVLQVKETDFLARAGRIHDGTISKDFPNYTLHVGPRLVRRYAEHLGNFDFKLLSEYDYYLTIYTDGERESLGKIASALSEILEQVEKHRIFVFFMPLGVEGDREFSTQLEELEISKPFLYTHMAGYYAKTLQHDTSSLPLFVLGDTEGKVISVSSAEDKSEAAAIREVVGSLVGEESRLPEVD